MKTFTMAKQADYFVVVNHEGAFFNGYKFVREFPGAKLYKRETEARGVAAVCFRKAPVVTVHRNYGRGDEGIVTTLIQTHVLPAIEDLGK